MSVLLGQFELDGFDMLCFQKQFIENLEFIGGLVVKYELLCFIVCFVYQECVMGQIIGKCFYFVLVLWLLDVKFLYFGYVVEVDG